MTVREMVCQMLMLDFTFWNDENGNKCGVESLNDYVRDAIIRNKFGGVILFDACLRDAKKAYKLVRELHEAATSKDAINQIPLLMAIDQEGGRMVRLKDGVSMPGNLALGAIGSEAITRRTAGILAGEVASLGFNLNFAPVLDINNNPNNPVIGTRSFSSDAMMVAKHGKAYIEGLHQNNVLCCVKHFPGHGDTSVDSHTGLPSIDKTFEEISEFELIPYKENLKDADMVMTAHILYPNIEKETYTSISTKQKITLPATLSKTIITGILRKKLKYDGVVITDALSMRAISNHFKLLDTTRLAINAGVDILLMPFKINSKRDINELEWYITQVCEMIYRGEIDLCQVEKAVKRILKLKNKIFVKREGHAKAINFVGAPSHRNFEFEVAKKAITLLKNDRVLPLKQDKSILIFVSNDVEKIEIENAISKLQENNGHNYQIVEYGTIPNKDIKGYILKADYVIFTFGETIKSNIEENSDLYKRILSADFIIKETHRQYKKVIAISCWLPDNVAILQETDCILCCYEEKENKANFDGRNHTIVPNLMAAFTKIIDNSPFTGKLPTTIYKLDDSYNYTDEILYNIGFSAEK